MGTGWQISLGDLSELLYPALFALAALLSASVLYDARRTRQPPFRVAAWTLLSLLFPLVVLPLYISVRLISRRVPQTMHESSADEARTDETTDTSDRAPQTATQQDKELRASEDEPRDVATEDEQEGLSANVDEREDLSANAGGETAGLSSKLAHVAREFAVPAAYVALVLLCGALFFYLDYRSPDAHLARAERAKLYVERAHAIEEYRAALRLSDDAHTHKLLGLELAADGRDAEALEEFRAAQRGGEPDERLDFYVADALDALGRSDEAAATYRLFRDSRACLQPIPDERCETARRRAAETEPR